MIEAQSRASEAAEQILANARKSALEKTEKESAEIISQAKLQALKEGENIIADAITEAKTAAKVETDRIIQAAKQEADSMISAAKSKVRVQIDESTRLMLEIQQRMQQVVEVTGIDLCANKPDKNLTESQLAPTVSEPVEAKNNTTGRSKDGIANFDEGNQTYSGKLRIDVAPPVDNEQLTTLEQQLSRLKI